MSIYYPEQKAKKRGRVNITGAPKILDQFRQYCQDECMTMGEALTEAVTVLTERQSKEQGERQAV